MAQTRSKKSVTPTVEFAFVESSRGRPKGSVSEATVKARTALDSLFADKARWQQVKRGDSTVSVLPVTPADVEREPTYTGLVALINDWAKDRGHSIRVHKNAKADNGVGIVRK